jgi:hypothetical protein
MNHAYSLPGRETNLLIKTMGYHEPKLPHLNHSQILGAPGLDFETWDTTTVNIAFCLFAAITRGKK